MKIPAQVLRQRFLSFFEKAGHTIVRSSSLVPHQDPTLLFTNAGMVQFKDLFTGKEKRAYTRATTSQKCVRAGGKHNDLENVGVTARHHTFFEMLGNFSFGDYFKREAIDLAWRFVTGELGIDKNRLTVTIFAGEGKIPADEEAAQLWKEVAGVPQERIVRLGMKDNFWAMGDTGPCGPCSEIHYFQGNDLPCAEALCKGVACDCDRYLEIWNLVFMQFERFADGHTEPLPKPSIDTGMGLERIAAVANGLRSNYDTDLLRPIIDRAAELANKRYQASPSADDVSLRVLADHARATAFLIADGVFPSNEGRGYVLRRIMRRAIRHGELLGFEDLFFHQITAKVIDLMGEAYPELVESRSSIDNWVKNEEQGFRRTLRTGLRLLSQRIEKLGQDKQTVLAGNDAFELYDTYGFPLDLTEVILREHHLSVDQAGFDHALEAQRARAGAFHNDDKGVGDLYKALALRLGTVRFVGYELTEVAVGADWLMQPVNGSKLGDSYQKLKLDGHETGLVRSEVKALVQNRKEVTRAQGEVEVILDPTPFYGESGGQIGDRAGVLTDTSGHPIGQLVDTQKPVEGLTVSRVKLTAELRVGDNLLAGYDAKLRHETRSHHSATHLLHKALRDTLGDHVKQAGSLVSPNRLRFDFAHFEALTAAQLDAVERHVNERTHVNKPVTTEVLNFDEAKKRGAIALFGEKYGDAVRVLTIADSMELCGGTHAGNTADIGELRITKEEAVAAGVRRIEAVVGEAARAVDQSRRDLVAGMAAILTGGSKTEATSEETKWLEQQVAHVKELATRLEQAAPSPLADVETLRQVAAAELRPLFRLIQQLKSTKPAQRAELLAKAGRVAQLPLVTALVHLLETRDTLEKKASAAQSAATGSGAAELAKKAVTVGSLRVVSEILPGVEAKELRNYADRVREELGSGVVALACHNGDKASVVIAVSKDLTSKIQAGQLIKTVAQKIGGSGGGKPDFAQAGGSGGAALPAAMAAVPEDVRHALG